jgi:hypothetical protein
MDGSDLTVVSATLLLHAAKPAVKRFLVRPPKPLAEQLHQLLHSLDRWPRQYLMHVKYYGH